jgi:HD superfamily phosphohydrolase
MLFHEVISGEIDVDRMDYLLRDSQECGVVYGYFDLGRILDSLGFYLNTATNQYHLALRRSGISAYEDYLRARLSMYHQVYFHKTATACEAMLEYLKKKNPAYAFPLSLKEYNKIDDYSFLSKFQEQPGFTEQNLANDLLLNRKLWKRVYEESILSHKMKEYNSQCHKILNLLKELNIPAELIETSTNLTKLSPKAQDSISKNNFKVIIKNANSFRLLAPIENHSNLINRVDEELIVKRIFIPNTKANGELIDQKMVQRIISELI